MAADPRPSPRRAPARTHHPLLDQLAQWHPSLFGRRFLPLKIGIYEDLLARHGEQLDAQQLKLALSEHTRSSRYLDSVARMLPRSDLDGRPVEPVAFEHVQHAIWELLRRRQARGGKPGATDTDPRESALRSLVAAIDASGLDRAAWAERVRTSDEGLLGLVREAFDRVAAQAARHEALLRAFDASGRGLDEFAQMYGMDSADVSAALAWRARSRGQAAAA